MIIVILRHSIRDDVDHPEKYDGSNNDTPLSERGEEFAKDKSLELAKILGRIKINKCYCSPFKRTIQTAEIYKTNLHFDEITIDPLISEGQNFHKPSGIPSYLLAMLEKHSIKYPESINDIKDRCNKFFNKVIEDGESCLISTHGIIYNLLLQIIFPHYDFDSLLSSEKYIPRYCDSTVIKFDGEKWELLSSDVDIKKN